MIPRPVRLTAVIALALSCLVQYAARAQASRDLTGLAATADGRLFGLRFDGTLIELDPATGKAMKRWYSPSSGFRGRAISAVLTREGALSVVTLLASESENSPYSWLVTMRADGTTNWNSLSTFGDYSGTAVDPRSSIAYVTNGSTNEVFRAGVGSKGDSFFYGFRSSDEIGPVALDPLSDTLWVGASSGEVQALDLKSRQIRSRIKCGTREARALAFDTVRKTLYVIDGDRERMWKATTQRLDKKSCTEFVENEAFKEPSAVAVLPSGEVWIADNRARKLVRYDPAGGKPLIVDWDGGLTQSAK